MAAFDDATRTVDSGEVGIQRASLSPDWWVWGPVGGVIAAIALRAMAARSPLPRPTSFVCQFLETGQAGEVRVAVRRLRSGRRTEALAAEVRQGERTLLVASAWFVEKGLARHRGLSAEGLAMTDRPTGRLLSYDPPWERGLVPYVDREPVGYGSNTYACHVGYSRPIPAPQPGEARAAEGSGPHSSDRSFA